MLRLEDPASVRMLKEMFAPDGGAEREHNAADGTLGFAALHYGLVTNLRPERALVVGSRYGFIPCVVGLALAANGGGELDFVDANYHDGVHGFGVAYGGVAHWGGGGDEAFVKMGLGDVVRVHLERTDAFFPRCTAAYGYIYLDGDHSYEGCRYDFEQALRLAAPGAMIALHDVLVTQPGFGVGRLFDELNPARFDKILIRRGPGLGLVQPKSHEEAPP